jgi:hypothetical protein
VKKVSELTGAELDYWTARADGVPAQQLSIQQEQVKPWVSQDGLYCMRDGYGENEVFSPSDTWEHGGPLLDKHKIVIEWIDNETAMACPHYGFKWSYAPTPLIAICRAVVRAKFGEEVEEVPA